MTRVVLVTGANRGIGRELARQLNLRGDAVVLTARDLAKAERAAAALPDHERVLARRLDVTDPASIEEVAADLEHRYGRLDVQVNNAAIHYDTWQQASTADLQVVREALEANLVGAWQTSLTLLPLLRASGHGRIVNVSSEAGSLASMDGGTPPTTSPRRPSTPPPACWPATCAATASWSTPCAPAGGHRHGRPRRTPGGRGRGQCPVGHRPARRRAHRRLLPQRPPAPLVTPASTTAPCTPNRT
jgi:NAD(P)-dependent dehydrogenase (short-subunit alcohol dehydrogenase family)